LRLKVASPQRTQTLAGISSTNHISVDHEYFIDQYLAHFHRTAYVAAKHVNFSSIALHCQSISKYMALGNFNSQSVYLQSTPSELFGKSTKRSAFLQPVYIR
jgi:hypothetical protein